MAFRRVKTDRVEFELAGKEHAVRLVAERKATAATWAEVRFGGSDELWDFVALLDEPALRELGEWVAEAKERMKKPKKPNRSAGDAR